MLFLFHRVLEDEVGRALTAYRSTPGPDTYVTLGRVLWAAGRSLQVHLLDRVLHDDNPFTRAAEAGRLTPELVNVARHDLDWLGALFAAPVSVPSGLPGLPPYAGPARGVYSKVDRSPGEAMGDRLAEAAPGWGALAGELADYLKKQGAGEEGRYRAFRWEGGRLEGIAEPDPIRLEELVGNAEGTATVLRNTEQFLQGFPANNLLLYGDRGTGKSSTVKALVHRYGSAGLRLVEVSRADLADMGAVMRVLRSKAQRFILFIDDLSFEDFEVAFKTFKAMLEGSLERRPSNVLVYATTNRRKLVRERWSDRTEQEDEVRPGDSLQEVNSLADRFGMTVMFATPDQEQYLAIVCSLAGQRGIDMPEAELRRAALQWAMWHNGWSGRTARQFIDDVCGRLGLIG